MLENGGEQAWDFVSCFLFNILCHTVVLKVSPRMVVVQDVIRPLSQPDRGLRMIHLNEPWWEQTERLLH